jgi:hypothetical protein
MQTTPRLINDRFLIILAGWAIPDHTIQCATLQSDENKGQKIQVWAKKGPESIQQVIG